jgi:pyruvyltransferase
MRLREAGVLWRIPRFKRVNNFGDLLGPLIVQRICETQNLSKHGLDDRRLLTVGSIINVEGCEGDVVWGSGIHGSLLPLRKPFPKLDIRAVRGPLTAQILRTTGNYVPDVYGDPALLISQLWEDSEIGIIRRSGGTVFVPNYEDFFSAPPRSLSPKGNPVEIIRTIASANLVIASSLHAIIIADSYGVPSVLMESPSQSIFKYEDYYAGTGRSLPQISRNWLHAVDADPSPPLKSWDHNLLIDSFPLDLWRSGE